MVVFKISGGSGILVIKISGGSGSFQNFRRKWYTRYDDVVV